MSTNGKDKSGRIRVRCSAATESGTCPDPKTFYLTTIEKAVLSGLTAELKHPAVLAEYVKTYHDERKRLSCGAIAAHSHLERRLAEIGQEIQRVSLHIAKGTGNIDVLGPLTFSLSAERKRLEAELAVVPEARSVVALHPATLARYEGQLARLQELLSPAFTPATRKPPERCATSFKP